MKRREKWGNISASLDSQNAREKDTKLSLAVTHETMHGYQRKRNQKRKEEDHNVQGTPHSERLQTSQSPAPSAGERTAMVGEGEGRGRGGEVSTQFS